MTGTQDTVMADAPTLMPQSTSLTKQELDEKFPNRPRNHSETLPFHDLYLTLLNPLNNNIKRPTGPTVARRKQGPHGPSSLNPQELRRSIIERFISRWRKEVGDDIYPAFRLILPDKDRERAMYGLKEKAIGRLLVKVTGINMHSDDALSVLNWKLPSHNAASRMAGDFSGRCYELITKRPMRSEVGNMTIGEVNELLDRLSAAQKEQDQIPIFQNFYSNMNADELMWLIRIILRQMKVGATERTFFNIWHPDADSLFNVSSSLRRVCWELYDPAVRLEGEERGIALMQCFQPQLAQFQMHSFQKMVDKMRPTEDDQTFWIEEKLDGERMQLHMVTDNDTPGGKRFQFWSRKAKDYTYLYGNGFYDDNAALTRHLRNSFDEGVRNIILDGEMITWDMERDAMVPFGTLKTAALSEQRNEHSTTGQRPVYRVFDILYLNGHPLTSYALRERRKALEKSVRSTERRLEIHEYRETEKIADIDTLLHKVVAEASEGLVLKNPRSAYCLNERNDDWMKVKPEYMTEFGESLDCVIIGGYYGSGKRGGNLSSFLCGLRVDGGRSSQGTSGMKFYSFFKVGGGFTATDYAEVRHRTHGKWNDWNKDRPPKDIIELGGGDAQFERPDVWIKPNESVVISAKAASVTASDQFRTGFTVRFPRFKSIREDRDWTNSLSVQGFLDLKSNVEKEKKKKEFEIDVSRKKRTTVSRKKAITIAGVGDGVKPYEGPQTNIFDGLNFFIMTESLKPTKKTKAELQQLIKAHGGKIFQKHNAVPDTLCIADRELIPVRARIKEGTRNLIRSIWLFDCINQGEADGGRPRLLLPLEPRHMYFTTEESKESIEGNADQYGDSYARDVTIDELRSIFDNMPNKLEDNAFDGLTFREELEQHNEALGELSGWIFDGLLIYLDQGDESATHGESNNGSRPENLYSSTQANELRNKQDSLTVRFAGAKVTADLTDAGITHVVVAEDGIRLRKLREGLARRSPQPRLVRREWIEQSWAEKTRLDEERFTPY